MVLLRGFWLHSHFDALLYIDYYEEVSICLELINTVINTMFSQAK
jgi:hypothetical protein